VLCKDLNAYSPEAIAYFYKRNTRDSKNALISKKYFSKNPEKYLFCL